MRHGRTMCLLQLLVIVALCQTLAGQTWATTYTYDALGRLTGADYGYGQSATYTYDAMGNMTFRATTRHAPDNDGIDDDVENTVQGRYGGTGDGNGDGTPDAFQPGVTSLAAYGGGGVITMANADPTLANTAVAALARDAAIPATIRTPFGVLTFTTRTTAGAVTVALYVPRSASIINRVLLKRRANGLWDTLPATVVTETNKIVVSFSVSDGGQYDLDGTINGSVRVQAAAAFGGGLCPAIFLLPR